MRLRGLFGFMIFAGTTLVAMGAVAVACFCTTPPPGLVLVWMGANLGASAVAMRADGVI